MIPIPVLNCFNKNNVKMQKKKVSKNRLSFFLSNIFIIIIFIHYFDFGVKDLNMFLAGFVRCIRFRRL